MSYNELVEYTSNGVFTMSLKHGLLGLLSMEGAMTGYDLDKFFQSSLGLFWHAKASQIYRELGAMNETGWLTSERIVQEDKPNKRVYSITKEGKEELVDWIINSESGLSKPSKNSFLMKIFFSGEVGEEPALRLLYEYREKVLMFQKSMAQAMAEIETDLKEAGDKIEYQKHVKFWKITALNGDLSAKMALDWVNQAIEILEG